MGIRFAFPFIYRHISLSMNPVSVFRLFLIYGILLAPVTAQAAHPDSSGFVEKRKLLAREFVNRLKGRVKSSESVPEGQAGAAAQGIPTDASLLSQAEIGTEFLLRPKIDKYALDYEILAVKGEDDLYVALDDFFDTLNLPVTVDTEMKIAKGWYQREDWPLVIDLNAKQATVRQEQFAIADSDFEIRGGDLLVASRALSAWMAMDMNFDLAQQYILIESDYTLPIIAQLKRKDHKKGARQVEEIAILPRMEGDYEWLRLSTADLSLRTNYRKPGNGGESDFSNRADAYFAGEALKHDAFVFLNVDDEEGLNSVTSRLFRTSDRPELLGPLKARSYAAGDVDTVDFALVDRASQGLGFTVSDNPLASLSFEDTVISGNAIPGWDVELYRDGTALIDTLTVDDTGRFEFADVQLFAGDNDFELYFYGDQGEVRRQTLNIPLNAGVLAQQDNTYEVSAVLDNTSTYRRSGSDDEDDGALNAAGKYNFYVGDALAYVGVNALQQDGTQKLYAGSGFTKLWGESIVDLNLAADEAGEAAARLGVRRNFGAWRTAFSGEAATDEYTRGTSNANPAVLTLTGNVQRNYTPPIGVAGSVAFIADHRAFADGSNSNSAATTVSQNFRTFSVSNTLRYDGQEDAVSGNSQSRLLDDLTLRAKLSRKVHLRAGATYQAMPESRMDRYFATVNYRPKNNLNFDVEVEHQPRDRLTDAELRANYTHDKFRFSPFLRIDSESDFATGFNVSTSLVNLPYQQEPFITSQRLSSQGLVSARVYLDANGNMAFDEGDEALPGVVVESVNSRRRQKTDSDGYALLTQLPVTLATDVLVDNSSLPDPFMISVNPGNSILPRPGKTFEMDFPVQFAGEVDGTVEVLLADGGRSAAKFIEVQLLPLDPDKTPVTVKAAQDGFYVLTSVPPGQYFLTVSGKDAKIFNAARSMPEILAFDHTGQTYFAQDMILTGGAADIDFRIIAPGSVGEFQNAGMEYFIRTENPESSNVLNILRKLRIRKTIGDVTAGLPVFVSESADGHALTRYHVAGGMLENAWQRCSVLSAADIPCGIDVLPPSPPEEEAGNI